MGGIFLVEDRWLWTRKGRRKTNKKQCTRTYRRKNSVVYFTAEINGDCYEESDKFCAKLKKKKNEKKDKLSPFGLVVFARKNECAFICKRQIEGVVRKGT